MNIPLNIFSRELSPCDNFNRTFDMTGYCGFALCLEGDIDIMIQNKEYRMTDLNVLLCMPFVNIEVLRVRKESKVIFAGTTLENALTTVNRTVATHNLLAISQNPIFTINRDQFSYIFDSIKAYLSEVEAGKKGASEEAYPLLHQSILDARCQLIVAQVLKLYFTNSPMEVKAHNHQDIVFQNFMLDIYTNFRENHNVKYYAERSGLSLKYFSTIVKERSGTSPSEWIEAVVMGEAKTLLYNTRLSIKEIAAMLNFPDAPTFTKYFQRISGITPRTFRQSSLNM